LKSGQLQLAFWSPVNAQYSFFGPHASGSKVASPEAVRAEIKNSFERRVLEVLR